MTPEDLAPILRARLSNALHRRAPANNISTWQERMADRIGVGHSAFRHWYYAESADPPSPLPNLAQWCALLIAFDGLETEVFGGLLPMAEQRDREVLKAGAALLRRAADQLENGLSDFAGGSFPG